jgi:hypothetical protein
MMGSRTINIAAEMRRRMKLGLFLALLFCSIVMVAAAVMAQVTGTTQMTVSAPAAGGSSLLLGMTPSKMTVPPGWTVALTQDFESGKIGPNEYTFGSASVSTVQAHTGTHSWGARITGDGSDNSWGVMGPAVGIGTEFYISFYTYYDPNATLMTEHYFAASRTQAGGEGCTADYGGNSGATTYVTTLLVQMLCGGSNWAYGDNNQNSWTLNLGYWQQEEFHFKAPSCNGGTPNNDGSAQLYINGKLIINDNGQFNDPAQGNNCSANWSGMNAEAGGVFTYLNNVGRIATIPSPFNAYIDDIIVLRK